MKARARCLGTLLAAVTVGCASLAVVRPAIGQVTPVSNVDPALTARYEAQIRGRLSEVEEVRRAGRPPAPLAGTDDIAPVMSPDQQAAIQQGMDQPLTDSRGTEIAPTTVIGLLLIRDMFILHAEWMADYLESIRDGGVADKRARLRGICEVAPELARLHSELRDAELAYNSHLNSLGEVGQISEETARAHTREADRLKQEAEAKKQAFQHALDEAQARFPEINGVVDGVPLWQALDCGKEDREAEQDRIDIYNRYLTRGIEDLRNRAEAARHDDTADELWKYRRSEYQGMRNGVRRQGESVNSKLPSNLMDEVEKVGGAYDIHVAVDEGWTKVILAGIGAVGILISPVLCLTVSVIDVTMEGDQLVVAFKDVEEARMAEPVLGWRHVITAEERARAANGEFVLAAIGVGLDGAAIRSMKIVGAADCPKDLARAGDAADAGRAADAAGAGRVADAPPKRWGHLGDATVDEAFGHPNIADDAWVHFGGSEIADGIRQDGVLGRSYWGRWGEVKNWTQGELRFNIGSMSKSGLSDLKTMVVAPDNAPIRVKRGEYGFEVEGVTDETIQGGRVIGVGDDPAAAAGRAGAADAGRADAPGAPRDPPGPPRAGDVARGAPEPGGLRPDDVEHWRRNEAERIERDRGYGIERADETDAKLERFEESIQAATDAGIPRADIDEALDAVRRKQVSIPSEGQTPLDVAIKDFRIRMVIKEAIRKDITIVLRETDRVHLDALGGGNAKVIVLEPADANLVIAKAATDRGQGTGSWTAAEADLARRLQREDPEKLYVFDPEQFEGGLYPLLDANDAANLKRIFGEGAPPPQVVDRGPPSGPPPDLPQRPLDPEADTSLEAGRARQPADERPPDHQTQRLQPGEVDESLRDAETVRIPGEADDAAAAPPRPLLSVDEYKDLVARQAAGEALDLSQIARPGIARALPDGRLGIAQGAGRWENARPDDWLDVFVDSRTPLPEGAVIVERGVDPELVRQANLLSSRGQEGTNPTLVGVAIRDVPEFNRIRIRAGDLEVPTSRVANLIEQELERLETAGVDVEKLRRAMEPLSPNERLALLRDDAARARALEGAPAGDAAPLPAPLADEAFDPKRDAAPLPAPAPGDQPKDIQAAPLAGEAADGPPAGAGNVPRAAEAGNVPAPDDREVLPDAPAAPTGGAKEVGAAPGAADGNPQVASVGTTFQHTISPIDFYMFPVLDLSDQTYTAINFPVTLATGRDVRFQVVILSGPEEETGGTRERRPGDPQPDRPPPTRTSQLGMDDLVPGGGITLIDPDLKVAVRSLGTLGNDAMELQIFGTEPGAPARFSAEGLVVEPVELAEEAKKRLEEELHRLATQNPITARLDAYCLDFLRQPPDLGTVFRIADQEIQQQFAPLANVLQAGRRLYEMGLLDPDSDPEEYFHSIRQWALWSVQENLDLGRFGDAFVEHTRKNFETAGQPWTQEVEGLVRSLVPNRWQDIAEIIEEAKASGSPPEVPQ